jgi:hypothetical protein
MSCYCVKIWNANQVQGAQLHIQSLPGWEDTPWSEGESCYSYCYQQRLP